MNNYDVSLDLSTNNSLSILLKEIKKNSCILEFGPAMGRMTKYLSETLRCKVYIVEIDEEAYAHAKQYSIGAICDDIEKYTWEKQFKNIRFDYILFADVLEHLVQPEEVLKRCSSFLKYDGKILASIPNIAHNSVIINLLCNKFDYTDNGLLDKTHLRFFTYSTIHNLFDKCDMKIVTMKAVYNNVGNTIINNSYQDVESKIAQALKDRPMSDVYQFVLLAIKKEFYCKNNNIIEIDEEFESGYGWEALSLYYDIGNDFNETDKICFNRRLYKDGYFHITNNFNESIEDVKKMRLDVCEYSCLCSLIKVKINDECLSPSASNANYSFDDFEYFFISDPFYLFEFAQEMVISKVEIEGRIIEFDRVANKIHNLIKCQYDCLKSKIDTEINSNRELKNSSILKEEHIDRLFKEIDALKLDFETVQKTFERDRLVALDSLKKAKDESCRKQAQAEDKIKALSANFNKEVNNIIASKQSVLEEKEAIIQSNKDHILYLEKHLCDIQSSTSWKATIPLRGIGDFIKKIGNKRLWRLILRNIYLRFPLPFGYKRKFKDILFNMLSPLLKNTESYRIWYNRNEIFEQDSGSKQSYVIPESNAINRTQLEYIDQVVTLPFDKYKSTEYLPDQNICTELEIGDIRYIAFYLPQFHPFKENDEWWGNGFTEWSNVTKAVPQFSGHYEPRLAGDLGYYDLRLPAAIHNQMEMAKKYGIYGFCIYYYWFDGRVLMETPLNIIMNDKSLNLPFCLCWANENWSRRWDGRELDVLISQNYTNDFADKFITDVSRYMSDDRYIKINGKPVLIIYNANQIPDIKKVIVHWRKYCKKNAINEIHLLAVDFALNPEVKRAGFDGFIEFPPHSIYKYSMQSIQSNINFINKQCHSTVYDYTQIVKEKNYLKQNISNFYKGIFMAWDNTARKPNAATIFHKYSVKLFKEWLMDISNITKKHRAPGDRFIFINAWNEWAEGTYLEPDKKYGYANLNAIHESIIELRQNKNRIFYVCHDACFAGAQMLALRTLKELKQSFHYEVTVILINDGPLELEFKNEACTVVCYQRDFADQTEFLEWVKKQSIKKAFCNTVVSGEVLQLLAENDVECVAMIHEMECVIRQYHCEKKLDLISMYASKIVFASDYVLRSVEGIIKIPSEKVVICPQGMFQVNNYLSERKEMRKEIREKYYLHENARIVLGVGYGYFRKGTDLFIELACEICKSDFQVVFMWVGDLDNDIQELVQKKIDNSELKSKIIFVGAQKDLMKYYIAADIFLLTSREDPFPSVVMEALYAYLPVIAFNGGGGYVEIVNKSNGALVPMEDLKEMKLEITALLSNPETLLEKGMNAHKSVCKSSSFIGYIRNLLSLLGENYVAVSVIIPNYNYSKYLHARIESVLSQTYPIQEIIILDDCSTDDSREVIRKYVELYPTRIRSVFNERNSKNVFRQWEKGIQESTGDFIWIAEADDLAKPEFLEKAVQVMISNSDVSLVYTESKMINEKGMVIGENYQEWVKNINSRLWLSDFIMPAIDFIKEALSVKNTIPNVSAVLMRRNNYVNAIQEASVFKVAGDWMFYVQLLSMGGSVAFISDYLNYHRRHTHSVTSELNARQHFEEICKMQDYISNVFCNNHLEDSAKTYREEVKKILGIMN